MRKVFNLNIFLNLPFFSVEPLKLRRAEIGKNIHASKPTLKKYTTFCHKF